MRRALTFEGALELDGPDGRMNLVGDGRTVTLRVDRLGSVPSLLRRFRAGGFGPLPELLRLADLTLRVGWRRWIPVEIRAASAGAPRPLRVAARPFRLERRRDVR